jgi:hypothetical protein
MRVRDKMVWAASLFLLLAAGACVIAVVEYPGGRDFPSETKTDYYEFGEGGDLTIENMDGDIFIEGWDQNEVELVQERYFNPRPDRFGIYSAKRFTQEVDVEESEGALRIRTRSADWESGRVDFFLKVPHSINLKRIITREGRIQVSGLYGRSVLELIKGDVEVTNYSGALSVFVEDGSIDVELLDLHEEDDISLTANRGDITLRLSGESGALIDAKASGGEIISDFVSEQQQEDPADPTVFQIGEGGAGIRLSTLDGSISILRIAGEAPGQEK